MSSSHAVTHTFLRTVLSRAVTYNSGCSSPHFDDDLRLLAKLQPTFLGRMAYVWFPTGDDDAHFEAARIAATKVRQLLPDVVMQAAVFEAVYPQVESIPIPSWVFAEFGLPVETRNFSFAAMVSEEFRRLYPWTSFGDGSGYVPDLTRTETQLYFFYRAARYLCCGYEAIHLGQPHLYAGRDQDYEVLDRLLRRIRAYAAHVAPRRFVLLDAHTHGIARGGRLLFDFHSRPISARALVDQPERIVLQLKGKSMGGIAPGGWRCESLPYLIELDNWGGYSLPPKDRSDLAKRASAGRWGWDDIAWFAHQSAENRRAFLRYAHRWVTAHDDQAFFQPALRRLLGEAGVEREGRTLWHYCANHPSPQCPDGFGDEDDLRQVLNEPVPGWVTQYHQARLGKPARSALHGNDAADLVSVVGPLQTYLGGEAGHSYCPYSRMTYMGGGWFLLPVVLEQPTETSFFFAAGGTLTEVYRAGGLAGGEPYRFRTTMIAQRVRVVFNYARRVGDVLDDDGNSLLLAPNGTMERAPGMSAGLPA